MVQLDGNDTQYVDAQQFAKDIHEASREAVTTGNTMAPTSTFVEWDSLNAKLQDGRNEMASYLMHTFVVKANVGKKQKLARPLVVSQDRLAGALHESTRAPFEANAVINKTDGNFLPFDEMEEKAQTGRKMQADVLFTSYNFRECYPQRNP